jgi:hypothetical protein
MDLPNDRRAQHMVGAHALFIAFSTHYISGTDIN